MTDFEGRDAQQPLPNVIPVTQAFTSRMATQRVQDALTRIEGGSFSDLIQAQPFRIIAFRALLRDYPERDLTSLWSHAYDVEVEIVEPDPTNGSGPMPLLPSVGTGA